MKEELLPVLSRKLKEHQVEMRADREALPFVEGGTLAGEEDWGQEYLDYIISIKTVKNIGEAIAHINRYNTEAFRGNHHGIMIMHRNFWMKWMPRRSM